MHQFILNHGGFRVQANSAPKCPEHAIMVSAPDHSFEMSRMEAEALAVMLEMALDKTGPRERTPIDLTGPDAPVFLRRQAD